MMNKRIDPHENLLDMAVMAMSTAYRCIENGCEQ
jgi:hypothetical protein